MSSIVAASVGQLSVEALCICGAWWNLLCARTELHLAG